MEIVKGKKFLVTGGTGFLGKNLVKYVIDNGGEADYFGSSYDLSIVSESERAFTDFNKTYDYIIHAAVLQGAGE
jgi:nucleoside-diphosphate-sugar epimerase